MFLGKLDPRGKAALVSRVTDTQLESEKQLGVMGAGWGGGGGDAWAFSPCSLSRAFRWLTPTRSQVAGGPQRCSPWGPSLGPRAAQEGDVGGAAARKNPGNIPEPLPHSTREGSTQPSRGWGRKSVVSWEGARHGEVGGAHAHTPPWVGSHCLLSSCRLREHQQPVPGL